MDIDDEDDLYAPDEPEVPATESAPAAPAAKVETRKDDLEEGEEEDEGGEMEEDDDSDVDFVTDRKDSAPAPSQSRYSEIRNIPQRSTQSETSYTKPAVVKGKQVERASASAPGAEYPAVSTSKIDVNAIPIHKGTGKPITQVNIDEDLADHDKPWRKPGTDLSDYFNYGFDEFTWALYAQKQEAMRGEYSQEAVAQSNKKMLEDMTNMMMMGGMMPGMAPGAAGASGSAAGGTAAALPGMDGMPPEMQAMMQQMMAAGGMDPNQMDPAAMSAMFAGMQNPGGPAGGSAGQGGQGQNYGSGFGGNQGQGYGYDQQVSGGGGGNRGNFGRGRGRRNWQ